jgi:hypothetical protein
VRPRPHAGKLEYRREATIARSPGHRAGQIAEELDTGGRALGGDDGELDRQVARLVDNRVGELRRAAVGRYERLAGQAHGRAVDGLTAVTEALRAAQVDALYLDAGRVSGRKMWIGPEPEQLASDREELTALDIEAKGPVAMPDALLRAAVGTGASFYPVGGERTGLAGRPLVDGVGAILRAATDDASTGNA